MTTPDTPVFSCMARMQPRTWEAQSLCLHRDHPRRLVLSIKVQESPFSSPGPEAGRVCWQH